MLSLNRQLRQFAPHTFPKKLWKILFGTNFVNDEFGGKKDEYDSNGPSLALSRSALFLLFWRQLLNTPLACTTPPK